MNALMQYGWARDTFRLLLSALILAVGVNEASAQVGACCLGGGGCLVTDNSGCDTVGGELQGAGTTCADVDCNGACCLPDETCSEGSRDDCTSGEFQGLGSQCATHCAGALGSQISYQGQLKQNGAPLTGTIDLKASLWTTAIGGVQVGPALLLTQVGVANGLFTVNLDFGVDAYAGDKRWLELSVRSPHDPSDTEPFTLLSPRQPVTAAPYSIQTRGIFVDDQKDVGIGTTAPLFPLHVESDAANSIYGKNSSGTGVSGVATSGVGVSGSTMSGIGVWGSSSASGGTGVGGFASGETSTSYGVWGGGGGAAGYAGYFEGRGYFRDNVGIGTTTPERNLDIEASEAMLRLTTTDDSPAAVSRLQFKTALGPGAFTPLGLMEFIDETDTLRASIQGATSGPSVAQISMIVNPGQLPQLRVLDRSVRVKGELEVTRPSDGITSASIGAEGADSFFQLHGGRLGVGTDAPIYSLHVVRDSQSDTAIYGHNPVLEGWAVGVFGESSSTEGWGVHGFASATSGINTGVAGRTLSGTGRGLFGEALPLFGTSYGVMGRSASTSGFDFYAAGCGLNYRAQSSRRWKNHIENIDQPLEKVGRLRGVYFNWDEKHGGHHDVGMIAEEVGAVLPEIVNYEDNGVDALGMDYSKLTPLLVEAVNALRAETDALRADNKALRARLDAVERIVARLSSTLADERK